MTSYVLWSVIEHALICLKVSLHGIEIKSSFGLKLMDSH